MPTSRARLQLIAAARTCAAVITIIQMDRPALQLHHSLPLLLLFYFCFVIFPKDSSWGAPVPLLKLPSSAGNDLSLFYAQSI